MRPFDGLAFLISATSAGCLAASAASIRARKPRGGGAAAARRRISSGDTAALAAAISARLLRSIFSRMSAIARSGIGDRDQLFEGRARLALVDGGGGERDAFGQVG